MNIRVLHSGFHTFLNPSRPPGISLRVSVMAGSKRPSSNFAKPLLPSVEEGTEKLKGLLGETRTDSSNVAAYKSIKDDPAKIDRMTVQELRNILRHVGLPAKGRKSDLVLAVKCFLDKQFDGESSLEVGENLSSNRTKNFSIQKEAKDVSDESCLLTISTLSEVAGIKQSKRMRKQPCIEDKTVKDDTEIITTGKLSIKTHELTVSKSSPANRKIGSDIDTEDVEADLLKRPQAEPWLVLAHKKPQKDWIPYNPRTMRPPPPTQHAEFVKLMSWNVNGLRALLKREGFSVLELAQRENFDVLCLQETKLQEKDAKSIKQDLIAGYENSFWTCSNNKLGYSGTAIVSRIRPLSVQYGLGIPDHDSEGRVVTVEFDSFFLINSYVPNSGDGLKRLSYRITQWDPSLSNYMKELEKSKPVILTGDLNCAHQEIDIYNPAHATHLIE